MKFKAIKIKDRLPDLNNNIFFYNERYKGGYTKHYDPNEKIEIKKGVVKKLKDVKEATDIILSGYTHWLEEIKN